MVKSMDTVSMAVCNHLDAPVNSIRGLPEKAVIADGDRGRFNFALATFVETPGLYQFRWVSFAAFLGDDKPKMRTRRVTDKLSIHERIRSFKEELSKASSTPRTANSTIRLLARIMLMREPASKRLAWGIQGIVTGIEIAELHMLLGRHFETETKIVSTLQNFRTPNSSNLIKAVCSLAALQRPESERDGRTPPFLHGSGQNAAPQLVEAPIPDTLILMGIEYDARSASFSLPTFHRRQ